MQQLRARHDVSVRDLDLGTHCLEATEMHVDLAAADRVAAGKRDARVPAAGEQGTQHVERGAHARDELVWSFRREVAAGVDTHDVRFGPVDDGARRA